MKKIQLPSPQPLTFLKATSPQTPNTQNNFQMMNFQPRQRIPVAPSNANPQVLTNQQQQMLIQRARIMQLQQNPQLFNQMLLKKRQKEQQQKILGSKIKQKQAQQKKFLDGIKPRVTPNDYNKIKAISLQFQNKKLTKKEFNDKILLFVRQEYNREYFYRNERQKITNDEVKTLLDKMKQSVIPCDFFDFFEEYYVKAFSRKKIDFSQFTKRMNHQKNLERNVKFRQWRHNIISNKNMLALYNMYLKIKDGKIRNDFLAKNVAFKKELDKFTEIRNMKKIYNEKKRQKRSQLIAQQEMIRQAREKQMQDFNKRKRSVDGSSGSGNVNKDMHVMKKRKLNQIVGRAPGEVGSGPSSGSGVIYTIPRDSGKINQHEQYAVQLKKQISINEKRALLTKKIPLINREEMERKIRNVIKINGLECGVGGEEEMKFFESLIKERINKMLKILVDIANHRHLDIVSKFSRKRMKPIDIKAYVLFSKYENYRPKFEEEKQKEEEYRIKMLQKTSNRDPTLDKKRKEKERIKRLEQTNENAFSMIGRKKKGGMNILGFSRDGSGNNRNENENNQILKGPVVNPNVRAVTRRMKMNEIRKKHSGTITPMMFMNFFENFGNQFHIPMNIRYKFSHGDYS